MRDLWIDFNNLDRRGYTRSLREFAEPGVELYVGAALTVGDDDGNLAKATVVSVGERSVVLAVDLGSFQSTDVVEVAYA